MTLYNNVVKEIIDRCIDHKGDYIPSIKDDVERKYYIQQLLSIITHHVISSYQYDSDTYNELNQARPKIKSSALNFLFNMYSIKEVNNG